MARFVVVCLLCSLLPSLALAQDPAASNPQALTPTLASDFSAISLAQQSVAALTGGATISDVTLTANVISILGSDAESGTSKLLALSSGLSRVDLNLSSTTRSDIRNVSNGVPVGEWILNGGTPSPYALHNCWTDASWFFPALSFLTQTAAPNFFFKYVGQEQHGGTTVQHLRVFQLGSVDSSGDLRSSTLSTTDFYLDATSFLPVAMAFKVHADNDMNTDIPVEIRFGGYQGVNGVQIPFHIQRMFNGTIVLDISVTSTTINSGPSAALFQIP
jgi:hypothetical protein